MFNYYTEYYIAYLKIKGYQVLSLFENQGFNYCTAHLTLTARALLRVIFSELPRLFLIFHSIPRASKMAALKLLQRATAST